MSQRRHLIEDLVLDFDTAQTVQVGHSPLPFEEADCDLPVRIAELPPYQRSQKSMETAVIPRRVLMEVVEAAPTVLVKAAAIEELPEPKGLIRPMEEARHRRPARPVRAARTSLIFVLLLLAISLASLAAGVLVAPMMQ